MKIKKWIKVSKKKIMKPKDDVRYFKAARSWADDIYTQSIVSRNRYQLAFVVSMGFAALLTLILLFVVLNQHVSLVVVDKNPSGFTYVTLEEQHHAPKVTRGEIESDIVRYVTARESYHPVTYQEQSSLVSLLSNHAVEAEFELTQSKEHQSAPVHNLGNKGYRRVQVKSILFLDNMTENKENQKATHKNLAQVNFEVSDFLFGRDQHIDTPYTALVSWVYRGASGNPETLWKNWSGFTVTAYQVQSVNVYQSSRNSL